MTSGNMPNPVRITFEPVAEKNSGLSFSAADHLNTFLHMANVAIIITDDNGNITQVNPKAATLLRRAVTHLLELPIHALLESATSSMTTHLLDGLKSDNHAVIKANGIRGDQNTIPLVIMANRFFYGLQPKFCFFLYDDSARVQRIEQERLFLEQLATVAHSIAQPSTLLLTGLEMMGRISPSEAAAQAEMLNLCLSAAISLRDKLQEMSQLRHTYRDTHKAE